MAELINLEPLKQSTREAIAASKSPERTGEEGDSDLIDWPIIDAIEVIDKNPNLAVTGSCSGHDGSPSLAIVFKDSQARDYYLDQIRKKSSKAVLSKELNEMRMEFFSDNFPMLKVQEEWVILPAEDREYTIKESSKFWEAWRRVLATRND